jgi:hypothetical protein
MSELPEDLESGLEKALRTMEKVQARLESGEEIDEKELTALSRQIATQIESVRARLEESVGPMDQDRVREEMRKQLAPEEFEEWLAEETQRRSLREQMQREQTIAVQLGDPEI